MLTPGDKSKLQWVLTLESMDMDDAEKLWVIKRLVDAEDLAAEYDKICKELDRNEFMRRNLSPDQRRFMGGR